MKHTGWETWCHSVTDSMVEVGKLYWQPFDFWQRVWTLLLWLRLVYVRPTIQFTMDKEVEGMLPFLNVWVSHDGQQHFGDRELLEAYSYRPILALPTVPTPALKNGISPVQEGLPQLHLSESIRVGAAHLSFKQSGYPCHLICSHYPISTNMDQPEPKATVSIPCSSEKWWYLNTEGLLSSTTFHSGWHFHSNWIHNYWYIWSVEHFSY